MLGPSRLALARSVAPIALLAIGGLSCGGAGRTVKQASGNAEPVAQSDSAIEGPKPEHLEVVAMTITAGSDTIFIKADGSIEIKGQEGRYLTLRTTGEMLHENGGLLLTLNPDGTITRANWQSNEFDQLVIEVDGSLLESGTLFSTITPEGAVIQNEHEVAKISGPVTGRRAAMLALLMVGAESEARGVPGTDEIPAVPAPR